MKKTTTLSRQKLICFILAGVALVLLGTYVLVNTLVKEQEQTVLLMDVDGDYLLPSVSDNNPQRTPKISLTYLNNVLEGREKNKYNVKKGTTSDILCTFNANDVTISYSTCVFPEVPSEKVQSVRVTNGTGSYFMYKDKKTGAILIEGLKNNLYNSQLIASLLLEARFVIADRKVKQSGDLSSYGLTQQQAQATVEITDTDGNINKFYIGSALPGSMGYYLKHNDKEHIYYVGTSVEIFLNGVDYFLSPIITQSITDNGENYIEEFTLVRDGNTVVSLGFIPEEQRVGILSGQSHRIIYPQMGDMAMDEVLYGEVFPALKNFAGVSVFEYNVSKKENKGEIMEEFGFDDPYITLEYTYFGDKRRALLGEKFADEYGTEYYFVYSEYQDTIVLLPAANIPFLEYDYMQFVQPRMFCYNIDEVSQVSITYRSVSRNFVLEGAGDKLKVYESITGKSMDVHSFRQLYIALLSVSSEGYSDISQEDIQNLEHELTFEIELKTGDILKYDFFTESTIRSLAVFNESGRFYTKRDQISKVIKFTEMLISGQIIETAFD